MIEYKIKYIDSYPGAGKTHWAIKRMTNYLLAHISAKLHSTEPDLKKYGQLFVYVAPTNALISEIILSLKQSIYNYVYNATLNKELANSYYEEASTRIVAITTDTISNKFSTVAKTLTLSSRYCNSIAKEKAQHNPSYSYEEDSNESSLNSEIYNQSYNLLYTPGSIVFITQAAFWAANHSLTSSQKTFWNRSTTRIIIDEARSCNCDFISIDLSPEIYEYISKLSNSSVENSYKKIDRSVFYKQDVVYELTSKLGSNARKTLYDFLDQYESASFFIKYNIKYTNSKSLFKATLVVMQIPYSALIGWKEIVLMSAFFKQSQLHAIIKSTRNIEDLDYSLKLVNITKSVLDNNRIEYLNRRLKNATLTWVFDNYANISKKIYNSGLVIGGFEENAKEIANKAIKDFNQCKAEELQFLKNHDINKLSSNSIEFSKYKNFKEFLFDSNSSIKKKVFLQNHKQIISKNPIELAITTSINFAKNWIVNTNKNFKKEDKKYFSEESKQVILINFNKTLGYKYGTYNVWDSLPLDLRDKFTPLVTDARGLNTYKQFSIIAVLSAFNIPPDIKAWFDQYCSEDVIKDGKKIIHCWYDQYQDIALGQVIQTMMRCSLRDISLDNKVLIILSTKKIAYAVNSIFNNAFNLANPLDLFPDIPPHSLVHSSLSFQELPEQIKNDLKSKKALIQNQYQSTNKYLESSIRLNRKELSKEDECYKAYKMKYYDNSPLRKKYSLLYRQKSYYTSLLKEKKLSLEKYEEYTNKLININNELTNLKNKSAILLKKVRKDFKEAIMNLGIDKLQFELIEYIDKIDEKRNKLALYFESKLESKLKGIPQEVKNQNIL